MNSVPSVPATGSQGDVLCLAAPGCLAALPTSSLRASVARAAAYLVGQTQSRRRSPPGGGPLDLDLFSGPGNRKGVVVLSGAVVPDHRDFDRDRLACLSRRCAGVSA